MSGDTGPWLADLLVAMSEWLADACGFGPLFWLPMFLPWLLQPIAMLAGAEHELAYYGSDA
ncbi:hypothetical protein [Mycobacterium intracellulare]|uniref:hypothetical protein n=1 Tax=Mycobacterium intracellulare TaxID=1767 RepID=UPI001925CCAD|nr:hypothetical protein [Mycobacterium intracellulare]BCP29586.1 hypothetical protein MINTM026_05560 [Mycobacterium intracellulare]